MKLYTGIRTETGTVVRVHVDNGAGEVVRPLDMALDVRRHGMGGFEWGCEAGAGVAQLALALLRDALQSGNSYAAATRLAKDHYLAFRTEVVAKLERQWKLTEAEVLASYDRIVDARLAAADREEMPPL